jgi:quercetin dioxygenase-like cupin family protein
MMRAIRPVLLLAVSLLVVPLGTHVYAQDSSTRTELKRTDLTGAPGMEVISSIIEIKPGHEVARHVHHGVESGYVLQGAIIQAPGKEPSTLKTGTPILNLRDVPHGGFKVIGDKSLKLFTVHVVDKDKPLYDYVK